jgi:hypothetical protein
MAAVQKEPPMAHALYECRHDRSPRDLYLGTSDPLVPSPRDVVASLAAASAGAWEVEQNFDPAGDVSIIVVPVRDDPALPTFMLYVEHGLARVAVIRDDIWESDRAFPTGSKALAAMVAATAASSMAA